MENPEEEIPEIDLYEDMEERENVKVCKIFLNSSQNHVDAAYTLKLPNFFTMDDLVDDDDDDDVEDEISLEIISPSFEFAKATWCLKFRLLSYYDRSFSVRMTRLKHEVAHQTIFITITLLNAFDKKYADIKCTASYLGNFDKEARLGSFDNSTFSYDKREYLTLNVQLVYFLPIEEEKDQVLYTDRDAAKFSDDIKKLHLSGKNKDLTLRVADKEFRVHQDILSARCEVFEAMLSHDMLEKNKGVIDMPDCSPQAVEQFLFYLYSGKVEGLDQENVYGLYYIADKYHMPLLKERCIEFINKSLSPSLVCDVIQLAMKHGDDILQECATEYFVNNTSDIFQTEEWISLMKLNLTLANELLLRASRTWKSKKS